jgi:hypothetical protein
MKPRCATCRHFTLPHWCASPDSKRGTFVSCQDKPARPDYGCIWHEPRVPAQGELLGEAA